MRPSSSSSRSTSSRSSRVLPNIEGQGEVRIRELVRNALRMRPDRIIVGEVRGPETLDMLQAMNTGHEGSLTTIHANSPRDALSRLETLVLTAGVELPLRAIREQVSSAFDLLVQITRLVDGSRRISHITEVLRMESDVITLQDIFLAKPPDEHTTTSGVGVRLLTPLSCSGLKPNFLEKMAANGVMLQSSFFSTDDDTDAPAAGQGHRGVEVQGSISMSRLRLAVAGLAFILLAVPAAAGAAIQLRGVEATGYPTIRASVYSPTGGGRPALWENGTPVAGFDAQNLGRIKAMALLIDRSQSMRGKPLADAANGARAFVAAKQAADELSVIAFGSKVAALSPFSTVKLDADLPLGHMRTDHVQGTALYDAIIAAANQLRGNPLPGRVIIVLSDGADNASTGSLTTAIKAAREANASIYAIGIEGEGFTADPLLQLTSSTGGQYYGAASSSGLAAVYKSIAEVLKKTWRIQYVTSARPGDRVTLTASIVGEGSTTTVAKIPSADSASLPTPSKLLPKNAYGPGGPLAIAIAVAVLVLFGVLFFLAGIRGSWVRSRIVAHTGEGKGRVEAEAQGAARRDADVRLCAHGEGTWAPEAVAIDQPHARACRRPASNG